MKVICFEGSHGRHSGSFKDQQPYYENTFRDADSYNGKEIEMGWWALSDILVVQTKDISSETKIISGFENYAISIPL